MIENADDGYNEWFAKWITEPMKNGVRSPSVFFLPIVAYQNPWVYLRELAALVMEKKQAGKTVDINRYVKGLSDHDLKCIIEAFTDHSRSPGEDLILVFVQLVMNIEGHTFFYNGESNLEILEGCVKFRNDVAAMFAVEQSFRAKGEESPQHSPFAKYNAMSWEPKNEIQK